MFVSSSLDPVHTFQHSTFLGSRNSIVPYSRKSSSHHRDVVGVAVEHIRLVVAVDSNLVEVHLVGSSLVAVEVDLVDSMSYFFLFLLLLQIWFL